MMKGIIKIKGSAEVKETKTTNDGENSVSDSENRIFINYGDLTVEDFIIEELTYKYVNKNNKTIKKKCISKILHLKSPEIV